MYSVDIRRSILKFRQIILGIMTNESVTGILRIFKFFFHRRPLTQTPHYIFLATLSFDPGIQTTYQNIEKAHTLSLIDACCTRLRRHFVPVAVVDIR